MRSATATVEIQAPAEQVWKILADFGHISLFNPNVADNRLTSDAFEGIGAPRHCDLSRSVHRGGVTSWEDGHSYTVDIYDGVRNPFAKALGTLAVAPVSDTTSTASMTIEWKAKGGMLSGLIDRGLGIQNQKAIAGALAGLKHHVETGELVGAGQRVDRITVKTG